jgi:DNA-binding MarR family transcriptional regulator
MADDCRETTPGCALTLLLLDAARAVEARAEGALAEAGLSLAKLGALRHLMLAAEPLTLSQLAERHCCGKSNVTQLVDRLESDGYVARENDPEDRRTVRATVTPAGRAAYERASVLLAEHEREIDAQLGSGRRADLAHDLKVLREAGPVIRIMG